MIEEPLRSINRDARSGGRRWRHQPTTGRCRAQRPQDQPSVCPAVRSAELIDGCHTLFSGPARWRGASIYHDPIMSLERTVQWAGTGACGSWPERRAGRLSLVLAQSRLERKSSCLSSVSKTTIRAPTLLSTSTGSVVAGLRNRWDQLVPWSGYPHHISGLRGPEDALWHRRFAADEDNFRAAVIWALDSGVEDDTELALVILGELESVPVAGRTSLFAYSEQALESGDRAICIRPGVLANRPRGFSSRARGVPPDRPRHGLLRLRPGQGPGPSCAELINTVRVKLGEERHADASARGAAMTYRQITAFALTAVADLQRPWFYQARP
jgi:hypothetical protein